MKHLIAFYLLQLTLPSFCQNKDTLLVYFPLDKTQYLPESGLFLDSLVKNKVIEPGKKIVLLGFGDYLGAEEYNQNLSYERARTVESYLLLAGFAKPDITLCIGKGKINRDGAGNRKGYQPDRKVEIIIDSKIDTPVEEKFTDYILRLKDDETFPLRNIHFYRGSLRMMPESIAELKMLYRFLDKYRTVEIQLEGHVCCLGPVEGVDEPYDESTLSQKRAEEIADSMVVYGIDKSRMKCKGLGNNNLIYDEETGAEDEALSRRVEIRLLHR